MPRHLLRFLSVAALALFASLAAADDMPAPVNGVSFEEWAAANARLSNNEALPDILAVLGLDEARWNETNAAFMKALSTGDPAGPVFARYGEVFANPAVGRFKGRDDGPEIQAKLATFEDYARVQAHLNVATAAGLDPQDVLREHDLTVYEYSQEAGNWVRQFAAAANKGTQEVERLNRIRENFEAEYRARYGLDTNERF
jgi:hypothetical protein